MSKKNSEDSLYARVHVLGPDDCWIWMGYRDPHGYGQARFEGRVLRTHQIFYMLHNGKIADGLVVRHTCDVTSCCNVAHLILGTQKQNIWDAVQRKRNCHGADMWSRKTDPSDIITIRRLYGQGASVQDLAQQFAIDDRRVYKIVRNEIWKNLEL